MNLQKSSVIIQHEAEALEGKKIIAFRKDFEYFQAASPQQAHQSAIFKHTCTYFHTQVIVLQK
jgi:hypothetical protein